MANQALPIYMDDHFAMIAGELELIQRVAGENASHELGPFLETYQVEVETQRNLLQGLLATQGQRPSQAKQTISWLAEKLGRLKPNDAWSGYTNLARVLELEGLIAAAHARQLLWETLRRAMADDAENLPRLDDAKCIADQHVGALGEFHKRAQQLAFAADHG